MTTGNPQRQKLHTKIICFFSLPSPPPLSLSFFYFILRALVFDNILSRCLVYPSQSIHDFISFILCGNVNAVFFPQFHSNRLYNFMYLCMCYILSHLTHTKSKFPVRPKRMNNGKKQLMPTLNLYFKL